jgi:hypothetical protein
MKPRRVNLLPALSLASALILLILSILSSYWRASLSYGPLPTSPRPSPSVPYLAPPADVSQTFSIILLNGSLTLDRAITTPGSATTSAHFTCDYDLVHGRYLELPQPSFNFLGFRLGNGDWAFGSMGAYFYSLYRIPAVLKRRNRKRRNLRPCRPLIRSEITLPRALWRSHSRR